MRRRRDESQRRQTFPVALLDEDLPAADPRVQAAMEAAGWSVLTYLGAKVRRKRERLGWVGNMPPTEPREHR